MLAIYNVTAASVQLVPSAPQFKSTPDEALFVRIVENLSAASPPTERTLAAGESLELVILPKGHREGNSLVITGSVTRDAAMGAYLIPVNAHTDAVVALLQIGDNDPATDILAEAVEGWLRLVQVSPARPLLSASFAISLVSAPSFDDIGSPTAIPTAATKWLSFSADVEQTLTTAEKTLARTRIGAASTAQGTLAATAVQPAALAAAVADKMTVAETFTAGHVVIFDESGNAADGGESGSGSGSSLIRASGGLSAHTTPAAASTIPAPLEVTFQNNVTGTPVVVFDGSGQGFAFADADPVSAAIWINNTGLTSYADYATAMAAAINGDSGITGAGYSAAAVGAVCTITGAVAGAGKSLTGTDTGNSLVSFAGGGTGTDATSAAGGVVEVFLIVGVAGKQIKLISASVVGDLTAQVQLAFKKDGVYTPVAGLITPGAVPQSFAPGDNSQASVFVLGSDSGEALIARIDGAVPEGSTAATIYYIAEQV